MKKSLSIALIGSLLVGSLPVMADAATVNQRQRNQERRIEQGVQSGHLTDKETARLEKEQAEIADEEKAFRSDGKLTRRERAKLQRDLNRSSRHIYRQKHDAQKQQ